MGVRKLIWIFVYVSLYCANGQEDCARSAGYSGSFYAGAHQCSYTVSYRGSASLTWFSCGPDYKCCENGCCQNNSETIPSDMETVSVVLSATAMFTIIILGLMIFGAACCKNEDDESELFRRGRK